jgi:hypothetical protein
MTDLQPTSVLAHAREWPEPVADQLPSVIAAMRADNAHNRAAIDRATDEDEQRRSR